jgi:hypothetical protein
LFCNFETYSNRAVDQRILPEDKMACDMAIDCSEHRSKLNVAVAAEADVFQVSFEGSRKLSEQTADLRGGTPSTTTILPHHHGISLLHGLEDCLMGFA